MLGATPQYMSVNGEIFIAHCFLNSKVVLNINFVYNSDDIMPNSVTPTMFQSMYHSGHVLYASGPGRPSSHLLIYGPSSQYPNLA